MTAQETLGKGIQRLRKQLGISQEGLALKAKIDRRYMSDIENGKRNLSLDILDRLAKAFDIPLSELFEYSEGLSSSFDSIEELKGWLNENDFSDTILLESPDYLSAIVGISDDGRLIYSYRKMVKDLIHSDDMNEEDAMEFIDYNTIRALPYMGDKAPIIMHDINL